MNQKNEAERVSKSRVVYTMPGMESVHVTRDVPFTGADGGPLAMDVYSAATKDDERRAAVVLVGGYPDPGFERVVGCRFKEMGSTVSWAQLIAASGLAAIAYTNRQPEADLHALLDHLASHAGDFGIDQQGFGVWASSGNAPLALSLSMRGRERRPRCTALLYPYLMDLGDATAVGTASATFHFANPCTGHTLGDLADDVPILLARAGQDQMPQLNASLDQFAAAALGANLPLTLINHPAGVHGFDLYEDSDASRRIVRAILGFLAGQTSS